MKQVKFKPNKPPKQKKCKNSECGNLFTPQRIGQNVCSTNCAIAYVNSPENRTKEKVSKELKRLERAEHKKKKDSIKTLSERKKDAQTIFNAYIRERDRNEPCISCGRHQTGNITLGIIEALARIQN